ncbi:MAG: type B 50S ribosomal protein L31 [Ignavibacteria bacterium]|jgi:large subunit ribosomal protein L31
MKKGIHPKYRPVVFQDVSVNFSFLTKSSVDTKDTIVWEDGKEYPLVKLEISSQSHPFFTGKQKIVDSAGRVERFNRKYGIKSKS